MVQLFLAISIHAPPRGATTPLSDYLITATFQFTPLREGRPSSDAHAPRRRPFQFTPLREGRQHPRGVYVLGIGISIHAPPRGATVCANRPTHTDEFQFTPLREGRHLYNITLLHPCHFNSRPSARGDQALDCEHNIFHLISIHAPPRGATGFGAGARKQDNISIHAPPRGATAKDMQFLQIFCSTLTNQHGLTIMPRNLSRLFW